MLSISLTLLLVLLIYLPVLEGEPVWDDLHAVYLNPYIYNGDWKEFFRGLKFGLRDPSLHVRRVTQISWCLSCLVRPQFRIFSLHFGNVIIHLASVGLVSILSARYGLSEWIPLIFAVHPLAVPAVAVVGQRATLLSYFFFLLCLTFPFLSVIALPIALMSKEDILGPVSLLGLCLSSVRKWMKTNDTGLVAASLPLSSHRWWEKAELGCRFLFRWFLGGDRTDYWTDFAPRLLVFPLFIALSFLVIVFGSFAIRVAFLLIWLSPFSFYWFYPIAHPTVESRAYSLLLPFAILASYCGWFVIPIWAAFSAVRCFWFSNPIRYWDAADSRSLHVKLNRAACRQNIGDLDGAEPFLYSAIAQDPKCGIAHANLGLIAESRSKQLYLLASQELEQTGRRGENYQNFRSSLLQAVHHLNHALSICPEDQTVRNFHQSVITVAKGLKVLS